MSRKHDILTFLMFTMFKLFDTNTSFSKSNLFKTKKEINVLVYQQQPEALT